MEKMFFTSDALLYTHNSINMDSFCDEIPSLRANVCIIKARSGVNVDDILKEIGEIEDQIELGLSSAYPWNRFLLSTLTEYPDFVVALTYKGFCAIANGLKNGPSPILKRNKYRILAEDLVRNRDNNK